MPSSLLSNDSNDDLTWEGKRKSIWVCNSATHHLTVEHQLENPGSGAERLFLQNVPIQQRSWTGWVEMGYSRGTIEEGYSDDREGRRDVCGCGGTLSKGETSANGGTSLDGRTSVEVSNEAGCWYDSIPCAYSFRVLYPAVTIQIHCGRTKFAVQEFAGWISWAWC